MRAGSDGAEVPSPSNKLSLGSCSLEDFDVGRVLGTGSFGRVSLGRHRQTGATCAVKAIPKAHIVKNQQVWYYVVGHAAAGSRGAEGPPRPAG